MIVFPLADAHAVSSVIKSSYFVEGPISNLCCIELSVTWRLWGAVCKNIISDRFSTKTAISGRDSYLCMQRCYLWQRQLSLHAEMLSLAETAISACRDVISAKDSYLCMQRCYLCQRQLSLRAEMLSLPEIALSACRDVISARDSYLCVQRCYLWKRQLSLHAEIALKHVEGLAFSALLL